MKQHLLITLLLIATLITSCQLTKKVVVRGYYEPKNAVRIIYPGERIPRGMQKIGYVSVGGNGCVTPASACTYENCMTTIKIEAMKSGANLARIVYVRRPSAMALSSIYGLIDNKYTRCNTTMRADLYVSLEEQIDGSEETIEIESSNTATKAEKTTEKEKDNAEEEEDEEEEEEY